ncbi:MAG: hypothetical protein AAB866_01335 [Patescibacteria group bacterium]
MPKKIILTTLPVLICLFVFYIFLVRQTIINVVARENIEKNIGNMLSSISNLETKYMSVKGNISLDVAYAQGFKNADSPIFITRDGLGKATLSYRIQ